MHRSIALLTALAAAGEALSLRSPMSGLAAARLVTARATKGDNGRNEDNDGSRQYIGKHGDGNDFGYWVPSSLLSVAKESVLSSNIALTIVGAAALAAPSAALAMDKDQGLAGSGGMPLGDSAYTDLAGVRMCRLLNGMWQVSGYHGYEPNR